MPVQYVFQCLSILCVCVSKKEFTFWRRLPGCSLDGVYGYSISKYTFSQRTDLLAMACSVVFLCVCLTLSSAVLFADCTGLSNVSITIL